jgi:hypothetical protein
LFAVSADEVVMLKTDRKEGEAAITEFDLFPLVPRQEPEPQPKTAAKKKGGKNNKAVHNPPSREAEAAHEATVVPFGPDISCQSRGLAVNVNGSSIFVACNFLGVICAFDTATYQMIWHVDVRKRDPIPRENANTEPGQLEHAQTAVIVAVNDQFQLWIAGYNIEGQRLSLQTGIAYPAPLARAENSVYNISYLNHRAIRSEFSCCVSVPTE